MIGVFELRGGREGPVRALHNHAAYEFQYTIYIVRAFVGVGGVISLLHIVRALRDHCSAEAPEDPKPSTLNPNPKPYTLNRTLNPKPSTLNPQP